MYIWCFSLAGYHFDQMRNGLMYHDSRELNLRHGVFDGRDQK